MRSKSADKLKSEGWMQRFTASGSRLQEAIENYRTLGYEVTTVSVRELDQKDCSVCLEDESDDTVMIFTRQSRGVRFSAAVLVASDRSFEGERPDKTGPGLREYLQSLAYDVVYLEIVPDDKHSIVSKLRKWVSEDAINLILVSGGTGLGPRDVTPEATLEVIERRIPGMEEAMRRASFELTPHAILSRAVVGCVGSSLIVNLPGNPKGALENLKVVETALEHALKLITGGSPDP